VVIRIPRATDQSRQKTTREIRRCLERYIARELYGARLAAGEWPVGSTIPGISALRSTSAGGQLGSLAGRALLF
jgi:hypothetical protein